MIHAIAIAALLAAQGAPAARCLTQDEAADLIGAILPGAVEQIAGKCRATLPAGAFLPTGSAAMVARMRAEQPSPERMMPIFNRIGESEMPRGVSPELMMQLMEQAVAGELVADIDTSDCGAIDDLVRAMSPLPARNIGQMFGAILVLSEKDQAKSPLPICRPGS